MEPCREWHSRPNHQLLVIGAAEVSDLNQGGAGVTTTLAGRTSSWVFKQRIAFKLKGGDASGKLESWP
jgi:hypothetical protein